MINFMLVCIENETRVWFAPDAAAFAAPVYMLKIKTTKSIHLNGAFRLVSEFIIFNNFVIVEFSREQI